MDDDDEDFDVDAVIQQYKARTSGPCASAPADKPQWTTAPALNTTQHAFQGWQSNGFEQGTRPALERTHTNAQCAGTAQPWSSAGPVTSRWQQPAVTGVVGPGYGVAQASWGSNSKPGNAACTTGSATHAWPQPVPANPNNQPNYGMPENSLVVAASQWHTPPVQPAHAPQHQHQQTQPNPRLAEQAPAALAVQPLQHQGSMHINQRAPTPPASSKLPNHIQSRRISAAPTDSYLPHPPQAAHHAVQPQAASQHPSHPSRGGPGPQPRALSPPADTWPAPVPMAPAQAFIPDDPPSSLDEPFTLQMGSAADPPASMPTKHLPPPYPQPVLIDTRPLQPPAAPQQAKAPVPMRAGRPGPGQWQMQAPPSDREVVNLISPEPCPRPTTGLGTDAGTGKGVVPQPGAAHGRGQGAAPSKAFLIGVRQIDEPLEARAVLEGVAYHPNMHGGRSDSLRPASHFSQPVQPHQLLKVPGGHAMHGVHTKHWIYPLNKEVREYQYKIVSKALFANTLVCLPTGLGKTLIAAVVMVNHYRWFPEGKVVFIAPTRPLVTQQRDACRSIMGVAQDEAVELTASNKEMRHQQWHNKRLFFCTPDILNNDLKTGVCPENAIVCLVVDECHRAVGDASAAKAVQQLRNNQVQLRLLALSATPGSSHEAIQEVITKLGIASVEFRSENDPDVKPYCHEREIEVIGVSSSEKLDKCVHTITSLMRTCISGINAEQVLPWGLPMDGCDRTSLQEAKDQIKKTAAGLDSTTKAKLNKLFIQAFFLSSVLQLVEGAKEADTAVKMIENTKQQEVLELLSTPVGSRMLNQLKDLAFYPEAKVERLEQELLSHYTQGPADADTITRAIVFTTTRSSVNVIIRCLERHSPIIKAKAFIGQGNRNRKKGDGEGMKQVEQKEVLQAFRQGTVNLLVATCIGEEGLDIPEVDLIVCYDASASPTRQNQRMGRTARHRAGRVVYVLEEPKEVEKYRTSQEEHLKLQRCLRNAAGSFNLSNRTGKIALLPVGVIPEPVLLDLRAAGADLAENDKRTKKQSGGGAGSGASGAAKPAAKPKAVKANDGSGGSNTSSGAQTSHDAPTAPRPAAALPPATTTSTAAGTGWGSNKPAGSSWTSGKGGWGAGSGSSKNAWGTSKAQQWGAQAAQTTHVQPVDAADESTAHPAPVRRAADNDPDDVPLAARIKKPKKALGPKSKDAVPAPAPAPVTTPLTTAAVAHARAPTSMQPRPQSTSPADPVAPQPPQQSPLLLPDQPVAPAPSTAAMAVPGTMTTAHHVQQDAMHGQDMWAQGFTVHGGMPHGPSGWRPSPQGAWKAQPAIAQHGQQHGAPATWATHVHQSPHQATNQNGAPMMAAGGNKTAWGDAHARATMPIGVTNGQVGQATPRATGAQQARTPPAVCDDSHAAHRCSPAGFATALSMQEVTRHTVGQQQNTVPPSPYLVKQQSPREQPQPAQNQSMHGHMEYTGGAEQCQWAEGAARQTSHQHPAGQMPATQHTCKQHQPAAGRECFQPPHHTNTMNTVAHGYYHPDTDSLQNVPYPGSNPPGPTSHPMAHQALPHHAPSTMHQPVHTAQHRPFPTPEPADSEATWDDADSEATLTLPMTQDNVPLSSRIPKATPSGSTRHALPTPASAALGKLATAGTKRASPSAASGAKGTKVLKAATTFKAPEPRPVVHHEEACIPMTQDDVVLIKRMPKGSAVLQMQRQPNSGHGKGSGAVARNSGGGAAKGSGGVARGSGGAGAAPARQRKRRQPTKSPKPTPGGVAGDAGTKPPLDSAVQAGAATVAAQPPRATPPCSVSSTPAQTVSATPRTANVMDDVPLASRLKAKRSASRHSGTSQTHLLLSQNMTSNECNLLVTTSAAATAACVRTVGGPQHGSEQVCALARLDLHPQQGRWEDQGNAAHVTAGPALPKQGAVGAFPNCVSVARLEHVPAWIEGGRESEAWRSGQQQPWVPERGVVWRDGGGKGGWQQPWQQQQDQQCQFEQHVQQQQQAEQQHWQNGQPEPALWNASHPDPYASEGGFLPDDHDSHVGVLPSHDAIHMARGYTAGPAGKPSASLWGGQQHHHMQQSRPEPSHMQTYQSYSGTRTASSMDQAQHQFQPHNPQMDQAQHQLQPHNPRMDQAALLQPSVSQGCGPSAAQTADVAPQVGLGGSSGADPSSPATLTAPHSTSKSLDCVPETVIKPSLPPSMSAHAALQGTATVGQSAPVAGDEQQWISKPPGTATATAAAVRHEPSPLAPRQLEFPPQGGSWHPMHSNQYAPHDQQLLQLPQPPQPQGLHAAMPTKEPTSYGGANSCLSLANMASQDVQEAIWVPPGGDGGGGVTDQLGVVLQPSWCGATSRALPPALHQQSAQQPDSHSPVELIPTQHQQPCVWPTAQPQVWMGQAQATAPAACVKPAIKPQSPPQEQRHHVGNPTRQSSHSPIEPSALQQQHPHQQPSAPSVCDLEDPTPVAVRPTKANRARAIQDTPDTDAPPLKHQPHASSDLPSAAAALGRAQGPAPGQTGAMQPPPDSAFKVPGPQHVTPQMRQAIACKKANQRVIQDDDESPALGQHKLKPRPGARVVLTSFSCEPSPGMSDSVVVISPDPHVKPLARLTRGPTGAAQRATGAPAAAADADRHPGAAGRSAAQQQGKNAGGKSEAVKGKRRRCNFIEEEADLSGSGDDDDDTDDEGEDESDDGFVCDETPAHSAGADTPGMAMYLGWNLTQCPESISKGMNIKHIINHQFRKRRPAAPAAEGPNPGRNGRVSAHWRARDPTQLPLQDPDGDDDLMPHERGIDIGDTQATGSVDGDTYGHEDEDDDACGVCGRGGDLILCDGCDTAFHPRCVGLRAIPVADWFCEQCQDGSTVGEGEAEVEETEVPEEEEHQDAREHDMPLQRSGQQTAHHVAHQASNRPLGGRRPGAGVFARTVAGQQHRIGGVSAPAAAAARPRQPQPPPRLIQLPLTGWGSNRNGNKRGQGSNW